MWPSSGMCVGPTGLPTVPIYGVPLTVPRGVAPAMRMAAEDAAQPGRKCVAQLSPLPALPRGEGEDDQTSAHMAVAPDFSTPVPSSMFRDFTTPSWTIMEYRRERTPRPRAVRSTPRPIFLANS